MSFRKSDWSHPALVLAPRRAVPGAWTVGFAVVFLAWILTGTTAAALAPAPFDFVVSPSAVSEGQSASIRIVARASASEAAMAERYDIYIMRAFTHYAYFLTPTGTWSPEPTPYLQAVSVLQFTPVVRECPNPGPPRLVALAMVVVRTSTDPLIRMNWEFQPSVQWVTVTPSLAAFLSASAGRSRAVAVLGYLGLLTFAVSVLVLLYPGRG